MMLQLVRAALLALGVQSSMAPVIAESVAKYTRNAEEAMFEIAWGKNESQYMERIINNDCKRWECDHGRAVGAWQLHRGAAGDDWAILPGNIDAQARAAARMTRFALHACPGTGDARILGAFRVLGGHSCSSPIKGEVQRLKDFKTAMGAK